MRLDTLAEMAWALDQSIDVYIRDRVHSVEDGLSGRQNPASSDNKIARSVEESTRTPKGSRRSHPAGLVAV